MSNRILFHPIMLCAVIVTLVCIGHAATVAISPPTVQNDAGTQVTLTISGLAAGQTVDVDRYADLNGNGTVDPSEPLVQHFTITEGQVPLIGGQRNLNVPGDDDGKADGSIQANLFCPGVSSLDRIAATYLYQVSDPSNHSTLGTGSLTVTQNTTLPQGVHGTITAAGTGLPLPHGLVALLANNPISGTVTDASGAYTLYAPPGSYTVMPVFPGYVANQGNGSVDVMTAQFTTKDLALATANLTVSGSVTDASTAAGLPGLFVTCQSSSLFAAGFTDTAGHYKVQVTSGQWNISPNPETAAALGYVPVKDKTQTNITGDIIRDFTLPKATALVFGTVQDTQSHPVLGLAMQAENQSNQEARGMTFAPNGDYAIGVLAGTWNYVGPNPDDLVAMGYISESATLTVQAGEALRHDFTLQHFTVTAHVSGRLVQDTASGPGIPNIGASACPQTQGSCLSATTGSDGSFDIGLFAGTWNVGFSSQDQAQQNLVWPQFTITVVDGVDQTGIIAVAIAGTALIKGTVQDSQSNPIAGLNVFAGANIAGTNYNANSQSDTNGHYSLLVADGDWQVGIDCGGLSDRGYACADNKSALINHADQIVNFVVHPPVSACIGDCGGDHQVTVDEILTLVNIALGNANVSACLAGDANHDGNITVDEILTAVNNALNSCPAS